MEGWNNTLRQRVSRYVPKMLSFSKSNVYHPMLTTWCIIQYHMSLAPTT